MKFRWLFEQPRPVLAAELAKHSDVSPLFGQCLINRKIIDAESASQYLEPRLRQLSDPFLLPGMDVAVERLLLARQSAEPLVIFGDYDVDGVTSTAILIEVLRALGLNVSYYLPHRQDDGYGLNRETVSKCLAKSPTKLLLAVDCGSSAFECVSWLQGQGVEVIILDHHQLSDPAPPARALVNPRAAARPGEDPERLQFVELCSAGLAFKLAHALIKRGRDRGLAPAMEYDVRPLLDLVALGTIADVVPLVRENRILSSVGLGRLSAGARPGIVALKSVCQCPARVGAREAGYLLAPRLNAAGRLETAEDALRLLMAGTVEEAVPIARQLHARNLERQDIEREIVAQVLKRVRSSFVPDQPGIIVEGDPSWHIGVVGIVASRVQQEFYRPTIILGGDGLHLRGSGRSVVGFDLAAALRECRDLLVRHGGHAMAAGVTIDPARVDAFRTRMNDAGSRALKAQGLQPPLTLDAEVGLEEMNLHSLAALERLQPFGPGNPSPRFFARGLTHYKPLQRMGRDKQHVKMWVTDGTTVQEAVWWSAGEGRLPVGRFDLAFAAGINEYNGRKTPQLKVLDWRVSKESAGAIELEL